VAGTALLLLIAALAVLVFRAWLAAARAALAAVSEPAVRRAAAAGERPAQALTRLLEGDDLHSALLLLGNACVLLLATLVTASGWSLAAAEPRAILHLGALLAVLAFAEVGPRTWGRLRAESLAYAAAPALLRLARLLAPWSRPAHNLCLGLLGGAQTSWRDGRRVTAADIQIAADLGEESGEVEPEVGKMLDEVMELTSTTVREVMTPRVEIVGLPAEATAEAIMEVAIDSGLTRLPVYEGDLDNIVGVLNVNDLLARLAEGERGFTARDLARPALFTPETRRAGEMLREMRERATHLALVVDQSGGTAGLVTIEDILEELVGEIRDEHDTGEPDLTPISPGELVAEGRARLEEVAEALGVQLPATEAETVGGLFAWLLARTPREGDSLTFAGLRWVVEEEEGQYVVRARITRLAGEAD
jgi:CBS domain containing-hemolysin-like protein